MMGRFLFMKLLSAFVSIVTLGVISVQAGNMFGPAPFRNGSPLVSGVDGTYQATATATNATGIFRFAYAGGSQTGNSQQNSWIFFINGQIQRGNVQAAINQSSLNGVLDSASSLNSISNNPTLPLFLLSGGSTASAGTFSGTINLKNPNGSFSGSGRLQPSPQTENTLTVIFENDSQNLLIGPPLPAIGVTTITNTNAAGTGPVVNFDFRGIRTSILSFSAATAGTGATNN